MPKFQGAIFDVDGVLVDSPHEKAWRESLRELMESSWRDIRDRTTWSPDAFTSHVYQQYVSGKPRASGARAALDYFHVPDAGQRVAEYAQRKQQMVVTLIQAGDFTAYPDALRLVIATKDAGMLIADASSSKNAALFLRQIRLDTFAQEHGISSPTLRPGLTLLDYFDADVSGRDFAHGKPDPEIFLTAAHELGVEPRHAIVIEDASAGIQAAKAGGMAAIGIARADDADLLAAADADLVVTTLDDVDTTALSGGRLATREALQTAPFEAAAPLACGSLSRAVGSRPVSREDLPLRFLSRQVDVQFRTGATLGAHRIPVLAGHDIIPVREVAVSQSRGERVASTCRVHDALHRDGTDELPGDPARAVPVEGHAATLVEGHAYRPDTAGQTMMCEVTQFLGALAQRISRHIP
jgi:beta-phosphoglucomutase